MYINKGTITLTYMDKYITTEYKIQTAVLMIKLIKIREIRITREEYFCIDYNNLEQNKSFIIFQYL